MRPDSVPAAYLSGMVAERQNRPDDAQKEYERALTLQPRAFDVLAALAHLEMARHREAQANALVKAAIERDAKNPLAYNLLGELYLAQHDIPAAIGALSTAVTLAPDWWLTYRNLALAKFAGKDTAGAIASYQAGIKAAPSEPQLVTELALLYEGQSRADDAISLYEAWLQRNPRVQGAMNNLAMLLVTYRKDRPSLDRARDLSAPFASSSNGTLLDTNGWVHFKRGEFPDALSVLERAADRAPNSPEIRYHLGMAELESGRADRARSDLQTAVSAAGKRPWSDDARKALAALKG